jgi:hypothetical protein
LSSRIKKKYTEHFDREHEGATAAKKEEPKKAGKKEGSSDDDHSGEEEEPKKLPRANKPTSSTPPANKPTAAKKEERSREHDWSEDEKPAKPAKKPVGANKEGKEVAEKAATIHMSGAPPSANTATHTDLATPAHTHTSHTSAPLSTIPKRAGLPTIPKKKLFLNSVAACPTKEAQEEKESLAVHAAHPQQGAPLDWCPCGPSFFYN